MHTSREFNEFCESKSIKHETTTPYYLQKNVLVERKNPTLVEVIKFVVTSPRFHKIWGGETLVKYTLYTKLNTCKSENQPHTLVSSYSLIYGCRASLWLLNPTTCNIRPKLNELLLGMLKQ